MSAATMTAGRELDALIAEKVMGVDPASFRYAARREAPFPNEDGTTPVTVIGRHLTREVAEEVCARENGYVTADHRELHGEFRVVVSNVEPYSTDIAAAWPVAHQMGPRYPEFFVALSRLLNDETDFLRPLAGLLAMPADEAAWFICRAALATVEATS